MLKRLGMTRVVIVQPSFYGTDNACTLDGIAQVGNARGVAVLPAQVPDAELDRCTSKASAACASTSRPWAARRSTSIKAEDRGGRETVRAARLARADVRQCVGDRAAGAAVARAAGRQRVRSFRPDRAGQRPTARLRALQGLLESGKTWVKISGAYRISRRSERSAHRSARPRAVQGQSRAHRLGLGLAAHAAAHASRSRSTRNCRSRTSTRAACSICCRAGSRTMR